MNMTVWLEGWQMQCCGQPFRVRSPVSWTLLASHEDWLMPVLGAAAGITTDAVEEHHGGAPAGMTARAGTVTAITEVQCRYAPKPGEDERRVYPVPGSAVLTAVTSADRSITGHAGLEFAGYLVCFAKSWPAARWRVEDPGEHGRP